MAMATAESGFCRIASSAWFAVFYRLILGAIDLLVGDARNRRGQALNIGANGVDLIS